jgi:anthranilate synthase component 2
MGLRHRRLPIETTQFHPESVGTQYGHEMVGRFIELAAPAKVAS